MTHERYTIVIKGPYTKDLHNGIRIKLQEYGVTDLFEVVYARELDCNQLIFIVHVEHKEKSTVGTALAKWMGELPLSPPFSTGSLLWYIGN